VRGNEGKFLLLLLRADGIFTTFTTLFSHAFCAADEDERTYV